ncbi:MAG: hypothetical protein GX455_04050 [Phycisphaerae bacterium]|nr:hypothetical protein [Phycisphaerae bacterium]
MLKSRSKTFAYVILVIVVLFLAIDLIAGFVYPDLWAFDAATSVCRKNGWQPGDFLSGQSSISGGLIGKIVTLEFIPRDQIRCKRIRIILQRPLNLVPWKLMEYSEEHNQS